MTTNLKDRIEPDELETYKGKWRNVWFFAKGEKAHMGHGIYDTEEIALAAALRAQEEQKLILDGGFDCFKCSKCGETLKIDKSYYSIQLPINQ